MRFVEVTLAAPADRLADLESFHAGLTGETALRFRPGDGAPFHHFALLVPGDRFDAAHAWAAERLEILGGVFDFENWDAQALYFEDPAGNIVELIAHRGLEENGRTGAFSTDELVGFSELGVVGDPPELLRRLEALGLALWDGEVEGENRLGFVGEKGRVLILAPPGRGWLPTGRPAEPHPVEVVLDLDGVPTSLAFG